MQNGTLTSRSSYAISCGEIAKKSMAYIGLRGSKKSRCNFRAMNGSVNNSNAQ